MMSLISVKIECACGQHYAFDVEPLNGRMPAPVACPACGADGSAAANQFIAQPLAAPVAVAAPPATASIPKPAIAPAAPSRRGSLPLPGQPDRTQIMFEARAKISWGDSPQEVLKYLMVNGFTYEEANEFVNDLFNQRAAAIRSNGIKYAFGGALLVCVPIGFWLICLHSGVLLPRTLVVTIAIGLIGLGVLIKGLFMIFAPKSTSGDVSEQ
jgi:hypothetical protein